MEQPIDITDLSLKHHFKSVKDVQKLITEHNKKVKENQKQLKKINNEHQKFLNNNSGPFVDSIKAKIYSDKDSIYMKEIKKLESLSKKIGIKEFGDNLYFFDPVLWKNLEIVNYQIGDFGGLFQNEKLTSKQQQDVQDLAMFIFEVQENKKPVRGDYTSVYGYREYADVIYDGEKFEGMDEWMYGDAHGMLPSTYAYPEFSIDHDMPGVGITWLDSSLREELKKNLKMINGGYCSHLDNNDVGVIFFYIGDIDLEYDEDDIKSYEEVQKYLNKEGNLPISCTDDFEPAVDICKSKYPDVKVWRIGSTEKYYEY